MEKIKGEKIMKRLFAVILCVALMSNSIQVFADTVSDNTVTNDGSKNGVIDVTQEHSTEDESGKTDEKNPDQSSSYGLSNPRTDENGVVTWDCVYFGNYPQSDATGATSDPIKWRVLQVNGNDAFLQADVNLDVQRYNDTYTSVTWETCTMRSWLNSTFLNKAFTSSEQTAIKTTTVVNEDNPEYGTEGGNNTNDKIFLLSLNEVRNPSYGFSAVWGDSDTRKRTNTDYVAAGGTIGSSSMSSTGSADLWWLRSLGIYSCNAADVHDFGWVYQIGYDVSYDNRAVCPALHLNLSSTGVYSYAGTVTSTGGSSGGNSSNQVQVPTASVKGGSFSIGQSVTLSTTTSGAKIYYTIDGSEPTTESILYTAPVMIPASLTLKAIAVKDGMDDSTVMIENYQIGAADASKKWQSVAMNELPLIEGLGIRLKEAYYGKFFPGDWSLKSTWIPVEAKVTYAEDGGYTMRVAIGVGKQNLLDSDSKWLGYKKALQDASVNLKKLTDVKQLEIMEKTSLIKVPEVSVAGFVETKYDKFGNMISTEGGAQVKVKWEGKAVKHFWTPIGPVYFSLKGGVNAKGDIIPKFNKKNLYFTGSIEIVPNLVPEGGYGLNKAATLGVGGKAELPVKLKWEPKFAMTVDFKAEAFMHVYLYGVIDEEFKLAKCSLSVYGKDDSLIKSNRLSPELIGDEDLVLIPVSVRIADAGYAAKTTAWNGGDQSMFATDEESDDIDMVNAEDETKDTEDMQDTDQESVSANSVSDNTLTGDDTEATQEDTAGVNDLQNRAEEVTAIGYTFENTEQNYLAEAVVENTKITLQSYILPNTIPLMEKIGSDTVAVFQAKDADRDNLNSIKLMSSVYRAGSWSVPKEISSEETLDSYADLAVFDDKLYLIWQKEKYTMTTEDEADLDKASAKMAKGFEVYAAVYDPAQNCFVNETALTSDEQLDMSAAMTRDGDKLSGVWVKNSNSDLSGTTGTNSIVVSDYDEIQETWNTPRVVSESTNMIDNIVPFYMGESLCVAYRENSVHEECILVQKIKLYNTSSNQSVTVADSMEEAALTDVQYLNGILYYKDNSVLKAYDVSNATTEVIEPDQGCFGANAKIYENGAKKAVLYSDAEEGCVYSSVLTEDGYSTPVAIYETVDGGNIDFVSSRLLSDGSWQLLMTERKKVGEEEVSSLVFVSRKEETDLSLDMAYVKEYETQENGTPVEAIVTNIGEKPVTQVTMKLTDESNTYLNKTVDVSIAPGEMAIIEDYADLSMITQKKDLTFLCQAPQEENLADNTVVSAAGLTDVAVSSTMVKSDGKAYIAVTAQNNSDVAVQTTLSIYNKAENGEKIADYSLGTLAAKQTANHTFEVPLNEIVLSSEDAAYYLITAETDVDDCNMDNNHTVQVIYADDTKEAPLLDPSFFTNASEGNDDPGNGGSGKTETGNKENAKPESGQNNGNVQNTPENSNVAISSVTITAPSKKLAAGKKVQFTAEVSPENATNKAVSWTTSNPKYATVDANGKVTFKKKGAGKNVVITATANDGSGISASYKVKIMKDAVKKVKLSASTKTVKAGKSVKVKATVTTTGKSANKSLKWTSSNTEYATVNAKGKVVTKKAGKGKTVTITAMSTDGSNKKAKIKIKIK